jgi:hypothetical protein
MTGFLKMLLTLLLRRLAAVGLATMDINVIRTEPLLLS